MLKIWGRTSSINVQKVMWTVAELGLKHQQIDLGGKFGGLDTTEHLSRNPHGLIPVIEDGGTVIWESHAIIRYLASRYGEGSLWPADPTTRAAADMWIEWAQTTFQRNFIQLFWACYRTPPDEQDTQHIADLVTNCSEDFAHLNELLGDKPFVTGDSLTYGDIPIATQFYRYFTLDIERPAVPHVEAWYEWLQSSPTYSEHVMVDYSDLKGRSKA